MFSGAVRFNDDYIIEVKVNEKGEISARNVGKLAKKETAEIAEKPAAKKKAKAKE